MNSAEEFTVYPAVDVRDGKVVRLRQGDYARQTVYPVDPFELARCYAAAGARWLHLVDLDAAKLGGYRLAPLLGRLSRELGLNVQTGGGVRDEADVERLLQAGATRVVVGSVAVREPDRVRRWLADFGAERLTLALDTRLDAEGRWCLPVHGWTEASVQTLRERVDAYAQAGLQHLLCTDIARDGMLSGPNVELYRLLGEWAPSVHVQASGGVGRLEDVVCARASGAAGVVLGKALLESRFTVAEALAC